MIAAGFREACTFCPVPSVKNDRQKRQAKKSRPRRVGYRGDDSPLP